MGATPWRIDIRAHNDAHAIELIRGNNLPPLAEQHLVGLIVGQQGYYTRLYRPDGPVRVIGHCTDRGAYVELAEARLEYPAAA